LERPIARARITLRATFCMIVALIGLFAGCLLLWQVVFVRFNGFAAVVAATLIGGAVAWIYSDYIEPLFYRLPPRGPDTL
jgi:4-hydroxybenzoate polyprenyltransferase